MYSNALTYLVLFAFALSISAILVVSLILKLRGQLSERGTVVARTTLAVAVLAIAIALVKLGFWDEIRLHVRRVSRWFMGH